MLFNSIEFLVFLPIVFILYWFVTNRDLRLQNCLIVVVSYIFYGWWDWRLLLLIGITSLSGYISGILIEKYQDKGNTSQIITATNIILNLSILGIFKYLNFFGENLFGLFSLFGWHLDWVTINILLPVGISFYTFQALSYTIDVYKKKIDATRDAVSFFAYISFFPQIVAGPIERATNLLPQFQKSRTFDYNQAINGTRQVLWGLFKKMVVADNCAIIANHAFDNYAHASGSTLVLGLFMFAFQIYGDFSGYSDIAIGVSRLFGFNLMMNFNFPYFSRDIAEFWRRWHISLSTWFRDYIYIPLGGSRGSKWLKIRNTIIIFLISGFWHGASWTFVAWGTFHALLFIPLVMMGSNRKYADSVVAYGRYFPSFKEVIQVSTTFILTLIPWIFFRSESIGDSFGYIKGIFSKSLFSMPYTVHNSNFLAAVMGVCILLFFEWINRDVQFGLDFSQRKTPGILRYSIYITIALMILVMGGSDKTFIYFQF